MIFKAQVADPGSVVVSLTVTMKVDEWREITDALKSESYSHRWSAAKFCEHLRDSLQEIEHKSLRMEP